MPRPPGLGTHTDAGRVRPIPFGIRQSQLVEEDLPFAVGDRVIALRNRYDLGLFNGDSGTVRSIHPEAHSLHVRLDRGTERRVPMDYLADGHLTHGYATTIHKAQGVTRGEAPRESDLDTMRLPYALAGRGLVGAGLRGDWVISEGVQNLDLACCALG